MPQHRPLNKPRSLHRQLSGRTSLPSTTTTSHATLPSALEHSLDEWLSRSNSSSSNNSVSSDKLQIPTAQETEIALHNRLSQRQLVYLLNLPLPPHHHHNHDHLPRYR
ncbi:unnamed protein product [Absidia cylindrospora]